MRINVYSQELTNETAVVEKESNTGLVYSAVQLILHSSPMLHHPDTIAFEGPCSGCRGQRSEDCPDCNGTGHQVIMQDDDRSAVTFWLPKSPERREQFAQALEDMAAKVRAARPETGLD